MVGFVCAMTSMNPDSLLNLRYWFKDTDINGNIDGSTINSVKENSSLLVFI